MHRRRAAARPELRIGSAARSRRRPPFRLVAALVLAWGLAAAAAHADLASAQPPAGGVHLGALAEVSLRFSSPVQTRFSRFEILRLELPADAVPADPAAPTKVELERIQALGTAFAAEVRAARGAAHDGARVAATLQETGASAVVTLRFTEPLAPGAYLLAWEALAADGHTMIGQHVFFVVAE